MYQSVIPEMLMLNYKEMMEIVLQHNTIRPRVSSRYQKGMDIYYATQ